MPASGASKLIDANVWLALVFSDHVHHRAARPWFDGQANASCVFCRVTQMALLRHLTNSRIMGSFVQSQLDAWNYYDLLTADPRVAFLGEPAALETVFRTLTRGGSPAHHRWTDAYLAAFAIAHQAQMVTFDHGFSQFPGVDLLVLS